nr:hypothetical protein [Tanacetum cinerariifolium]
MSKNQPLKAIVPPASPRRSPNADEGVNITVSNSYAALDDESEEEWPKHASNGVSLTKDGSFAAVCTMRDCKDYVNLISCHSWEIMGVFAVDTLDLADVEWSSDDSAIVIWDLPLEYKACNCSLLF